MGDSSSGHVFHCFKLLPSSVHVSSSGATSTGGGCSVSRLAGKVGVHVSTFSLAQQSYSETTVHAGGRSNSDSPLVAETVVVSTPNSSLCGSSTILSIPPRSPVSTGSEIRLGRKVVSSARMEALVRHYKAAGFSDEVSRLAAAPRRPSTNRMYDDRWLRYIRWAAGQEFDLLSPTAAQIASFLYSLFDNHGLSPQTIKGYRIMSQIFGFWGTPVVDMFATVSNSRLPQFMSPIPEPRALSVDALSQNWQGRSMYMFPPFPLLSKVIQKLRSMQEAEVILIAPLVAKTVVVSTPTSSL